MNSSLWVAFGGILVIGLGATAFCFVGIRQLRRHRNAVLRDKSVTEPQS